MVNKIANLFDLQAKITLDSKDYEKGIRDAGRSGNELSKNLNNTVKNSETLANKIKVLGAQYSSAKSKVDDLTVAFNKSAKENGITSEKTQKLAKELAKAEAKADSFEKSLKDLEKQSGDTGEELEESGEKASKFGGKLKGVLGTAAKVGGAAIAAAGTAISAFGVKSVKSGEQFDASMSQVAATMGYTLDELNDIGSEAAQTFETLRNFAQKMGAETAFSASESADALNYMALAGYDAETSMSMLPSVLNLAAAGSIDLANASDMVTDAQSALGLSIEETSDMVDQMAKASSKSNTSVAQLGEAFLTIGANAQTLSGGTVELSTALGVLANSGIKGAEGGTHLRNVLLSLQTPTDEASGALSALGVSVYDAQGEMLPLNDILGNLNDSMSEMTSSERTDIINKIFNKTDLAAVNALLAGAGDEWDNLATTIENSEGAAQNMADVQLDNLQGDITLFKSALEGAEIALSDGITPKLREFVQIGTDGLSDVANALQNGDISGAMDAIGEALSNAVSTLFNDLPEIVSAANDLLGAFAEGVIENLPMLIEAAMQIVLELANGITESLPELIPTIIDVVIQIMNALIENAPLLLTAALQLIVQLGLGLIQAIPELVANIPQIISAIIEGLGEGMSGIKDVGKNLVEGLWNGIGDMVGWIKEKISGFGADVLGALKGFFGIKSPSRLMRDVIGKNLALGIGVGFENTMPDVLDDMKGTLDINPLASSVEVSASGGGSRSSSGGGGSVINIYTTDLTEAQIDYLFTRFNAKMGAMA